MFSLVVILSQVLRQASDDPNIKAFRELLLRIRDGVITHSNWQTLLQRSPMKASNSASFDDAYSMTGRVLQNLTMKSLLN